jgi:hypothetical protein
MLIHSKTNPKYCAKVDHANEALVVMDSYHGRVHDGKAFTLAGTFSIASAKTAAISFKGLTSTFAKIYTYFPSLNTTIRFTAIKSGILGNNINVVLTESPGTPNLPMAITVSGETITICFRNNSSGVPNSTPTSITDGINTNTEAAALVTAFTYGDNKTATAYIVVATKTVGVTGTPFHLKPASFVTSNGPVTITLLEDNTFTDGTTVTPNNRNRAGTPGASNTTIKTLADATAIAGSAPQTLDTLLLTAVTSAGRLGGNDPDKEWILNPDKNYLIAIANGAGAGITVGYDVSWYEF